MATTNREVDRSRDLLETLVRTQSEIADAGSDYDRVLELVAQQALQLTDADGAVVELTEGDEMVYRAAAGVAKEHVGLRLAVSTSLSGQAVLRNEILVCEDSEADRRVDHEAARKVGARSMILVPLTGSAGAVGVLKVYSRRPAAFSETHAALLRLVAGLMSSSILDAERTRDRDRLARRLQAVIEASPQAILAVNREGLITLWSPSAEALYGWTSEEAVGREPRVFPPDREVVARDRLDRILAGEEIRNLETEHISRDGEPLQVEVSGVPKRDRSDEIVGAVLFVADIRERMRLEQLLLRAQKMEMETIGRLAGGVAHGFNNMLTAIQGFARMLLEDGLSDDQRSCVMEILRAAQRSTYITRQLLAYSRQQVLQVTSHDPGNLVREMTGTLGHLLGEHISFHVHIAKRVWMVEADKGQFEQVILNLLVNARDAIAPGHGTVSLRLSNEVLDEAAAAEIGVSAGEYVEIQVQDTGGGISPEVIEHIFEPFFTTRGITEGTGLGLATVEGIVAQSHGGIVVSSVPGEGSTFSVYLPRSVKPAARQATRKEGRARVLSSWWRTSRPCCDSSRRCSRRPATK